MDDLDIIIESFEQNDDDGVCMFRGSSLIINGEKVDSNGDHIKAILEYLGYNATVYYN